MTPVSSSVPMTIAHFSDPHLSHEPRLDWRQKFSKRQLSAWSWRRARRGVQQSGVLEALVADLRVCAPEHIVITGDLINFSLHDEFAAAADWLRALGPADRVSVVPGNHDALVAVDGGQGLDRWRPWMSDDANDGADHDSPMQWPYVRVRGDIALIGLNSARPTWPALASGHIGAVQLKRLEPMLAELRTRGLFRIVLVHHPVADEVVSARKALRDRAGLRSVLSRAGAELVLHGHARDARFDTIAGPSGPILCLGLPSSSALPSRKDQGARWHQLRIARDSHRSWQLQVTARIWDTLSAAFVAGGGYTVNIALAI